MPALTTEYLKKWKTSVPTSLIVGGGLAGVASFLVTQPFEILKNTMHRNPNGPGMIGTAKRTKHCWRK